MGKPVLGYYKLRGLAMPIRHFCAYAGIEYEEKIYDSFEDWQTEKFTLGLKFPNVPYWIDENVKLTESKVILRYLAKEKTVNLFPTDANDVRLAEMLEGLIQDLWNLLIHLAYNDMKEYFEFQAPGKFKQLVDHLGTQKYLLGDNISYVDFLLYEILYQYSTYKADYFNDYAKLQEYKKQIEEIPSIKAYMESPEYIKGPCFNVKYAINKF